MSVDLRMTVSSVCFYGKYPVIVRTGRQSIDCYSELYIMMISLNKLFNAFVLYVDQEHFTQCPLFPNPIIDSSE